MGEGLGPLFCVSPAHMSHLLSAAACGNDTTNRERAGLLFAISSSSFCFCGLSHCNVGLLQIVYSSGFWFFFWSTWSFSHISVSCKETRPNLRKDSTVHFCPQKYVYTNKSSFLSSWWHRPALLTPVCCCL